MNHYAFEKLMTERQGAILEEAARNGLLHLLPRQPSSLLRLRLALGRLLIVTGQRLQGKNSTNTPVRYS